MKVTGYRTVSTVHDWGRRVGDTNGSTDGHLTRFDVLVLETDDGYEGIGVGAHTAIESVFPVIEGADPRGVVGLYDRMLAHVFKTGHQGGMFATLGAVDAALWDLKAKSSGQALWRLLGADDRFVRGYASALEEPLDDDAAVAVWSSFAERGFAAGKLKVGRDIDRDLRRLGLMRDSLSMNSSKPALMIDANESWHVSQAVRNVRRMEDSFDLTWVEEPVRRWDVAGLANVAGRVRAAVATGENLTGLEQFRALIEARAVGIVQPGAGWGITHYLRVAHLALAFDLPVSPVGFTSSVLAAAAVVPNLIAVEVQALQPPMGLHFDHTIEDGGTVLGDAPGHGITLHEEDIPLAVAAGWGGEHGPHVRPGRAGLRLYPEDERPFGTQDR